MSTTERLLVLFDGHALVHRAFHALPPFTVLRTGEPTGAVYGFASMLLKVLSELKPTHWAIAFDSPGPTFRHQEYAEYKAHRPPAPDELRQQFGRVREVVNAFAMPTYETPGYEADDVLGALAQLAEEQGTRTVIVTGDTDTLQLVSDHVSVMVPRPGKTFSDTTLYDDEAVRQRYGLEPNQLADLRGLKGDPSDNIPGVAGIGEKTAVKLLQQFGSIEGIYDHIDEVSPERIRKLLVDGEEQARASKRLATIVIDLPLEFDLDSCCISLFDRSRVADLFRELSFASLLPKLPDSGAQSADASVELQSATIATEYVVVDTPQTLQDMVGELSRAGDFAFDTETSGLDPRQAALVGLSFSTAPGRAWYVPVGHSAGTQIRIDQALAAVRPLLGGDETSKSAHNAKFDMTVLQRYDVQVANVAFDTMIAAYLLGDQPLNLKSLAFSRLGIEMTPIVNLIGTGSKQISMGWVDIPRVADYACADADITLRLARLMKPELSAQGLWKLFSEVEMPLLPVLLDMETNGVSVDTEMLRDMSWRISGKLSAVEKNIHELAGRPFNINSSQQLGCVLFEDLRLPTGKRTKSGYSTSASILEGMRGAHPIVDLLLEYRQLAKLKSTYVDALPALVNPETGRIHTTLNQTGTSTGRLSSSDPNLQNIPVRTEEGRQVRRAFVAGDSGSLLLSADYSQIDLRALAHLSQDPILISAFERDEDIHAITASQVFGIAPEEITPDMRRFAKTINFGVIYGMSEYGLEQATDLSRQEAGLFIKAYFEKYRGVQAYLDATKREAAHDGYVQTILGRRRYIPEIKSPNAQVRMAAERMAINMPVQGTSADIIKVAMVSLHREMKRQGFSAKMILQVHDELLFEVPLSELDALTKLAYQIMPDAISLSVPLKIDVKTGSNWDEMEYQREAAR